MTLEILTAGVAGILIGTGAVSGVRQNFLMGFSLLVTGCFDKVKNFF